MHTYSIAQWACALALMGAGAFVLCFLWGFLLTDPALLEFHRNSLRVFLTGATFVGPNFLTLVVGTLMAAFWGAVTGTVLVLCLNHCARKPR